MKNILKTINDYREIIGAAALALVWAGLQNLADPFTAGSPPDWIFRLAAAASICLLLPTITHWVWCALFHSLKELAQSESAMTPEQREVYRNHVYLTYMATLVAVAIVLARLV